jgi:outer membrane protein TolC
MDDTDWFVGVQLSYPLFSGGARFAENDQAAEELVRIGTEKAAATERVEQSVHSALHDLGASLAGIDLSRDAAVATRSNYDLVSDAYRRGAVSILDLLDAQNSSLSADEAAANAVFDFLIDLMNVQRASGRIGVFSTQEEKDAYFERLKMYFDKERDSQ